MNNDQPIIKRLEEMLRFIEKFEIIYIYGNEHDQLMLNKYLNMIDYTVSGYIISDNKFNKLQDCKNCISCSKLKSNYKDYSDIGIIVATWDLYFNEIIANLNEIGFPIMNTYFLPGWNKRTISHKMTPRSKERIGIEVNLADHCNLNCQMCDHFAPLAKPTFLDIKAFRKDMERLAYLTNNHIGIMRLEGGEPLLNDDTIEFIKITRELFPNSIILFFTDGLLLKKWENHPTGNFWQICHDYNVRIEFTVYPIGIKVNEIQDLAKKYNVMLDVFTEAGHRKLEGIKKSVKHPFDLEGNVEKWQFISCFQFNECITLRNGKLYTCPIIPYIEHFNNYFNQNLQVSSKDYIDIYEAKTYEELAEFVTHRTDFCRYCKIKERKVFDWKQSKRVIEEYI